MAAVINSNIAVLETEYKTVDRLAQCSGSLKVTSSSSDQVSLLEYDSSFAPLAGPTPTHSLLLSSSETSKNPFFHEACVYLPAHDELFITSNLLQATKSSNFPTILISRVKLVRQHTLQVPPSSTSTSTTVTSAEWVKMRPPPGIDMPNGGVNYHDNSILFCAQGSASPGTGGIWHMPRGSTAPRALVTNFHGRDFNSPNDVVVAADGAIWFTDPSYAYGQDFRGPPVLPDHVYRFDPATGDIRVVADGLGKPNGICFSPRGEKLYVTDTDMIAGDGTIDSTKAATIYAFDVATYSEGPFLVNKRVFAYADEGWPDGIKCDVYGNVYSGCGDGVEVWNAGGTLIGKILVPGGVANFCFGKEGELFLCAEQKLWRVQLASTTKGALLGI